MQIKDVMTPNVELAHPDMTIREAAAKMRELDTGFLPVALGDRLVGTLTDRDIAMRSTAEGQNPNAARVAEAMSNGLIYCYEDQNIEDAIALMGEKQIRRLPILSRDKRLVGILSLGDAAIAGADDRVVGEAVEQVSHHGNSRHDRQAGNGHNRATNGASHGWLSVQTVRDGFGSAADRTGLSRHPVIGVTGVLGIGALIAGIAAGGRQWRGGRSRW
jgi:CBS domain-containing protein